MPLELTPRVLVVLGAAALLIGLAKGGLAGGLGPLITVLVSTVVPATQAIGVLLPMLMVGDVAAVWVHRRDWSRPAVAAMLPAAAVGVAVASVLLGSASDRLVEVVLGVLSIAFVAHRAWQGRGAPRRSTDAGRDDGDAPSDADARADGDAEPAPGRWLGILAGGVSGVTSTIAHAGGPPVSIYLLATRMPPVRFAATAAVFFMAVNLLKVPGYLAAGLLETSNLRVLPLALLLVPGTWAGRWLVRRIRQRAFDRLVMGLLTIGALNLLLG